MVKERKKQVAFVRWFEPLLNALRELGYSGKSQEVINKIAEKEQLDDKTLEATIKSGVLKFPNEVAWAKQYLTWEGLVSSTKRGTWTLTEKGKDTHLNNEEAHEIFYKWTDYHRKNKKDEKEEFTKDASEDTVNTKLLDVLKSLSPKAFENICKELLREHGFENVEVTRYSKDGGIDGYGMLEVNPFVNVKVCFQCKRYEKTVTTSDVRSFFGAMCEKQYRYGILMTTGNFTKDAENFVSNLGEKMVELVNGEKLVEMFEKVELGVTPRIIYEVDPSYFEKFKD